jgi:hypothetical protein
MSESTPNEYGHFPLNAENVTRNNRLIFRSLRRIGLIKTSEDIRYDSQQRLQRAIDEAKAIGIKNVRGVVYIPSEQGGPILRR